MTHENLQLRSCEDCEHDCAPLPYGCKYFKSAYKHKSECMNPNPDAQQICLEGWQAGFKAGAETVLQKIQTDSFDREEDAYNG